MAPVMAPPDLAKAAAAVAVVDVSIPSRVAISTPSTVLLVVKAPVSAPPVLGKAASAVVVVEVKLVVVAKPALGITSAAVPLPSSGVSVIAPFALFNLIDII
jgi:hypothetical protein